MKSNTNKQKNSAQTQKNIWQSKTKHDNRIGQKNTTIQNKMQPMRKRARAWKHHRTLTRNRTHTLAEEQRKQEPMDKVLGTRGPKLGAPSKPLQAYRAYYYKVVLEWHLQGLGTLGAQRILGTPKEP